MPFQCLSCTLRSALLRRASEAWEATLGCLSPSLLSESRCQAWSRRGPSARLHHPPDVLPPVPSSSPITGGPAEAGRVELGVCGGWEPIQGSYGGEYGINKALCLPQAPPLLHARTHTHTRTHTQLKRKAHLQGNGFATAGIICSIRGSQAGQGEAGWERGLQVGPGGYQGRREVSIGWDLGPYRGGRLGRDCKGLCVDQGQVNGHCLYCPQSFPFCFRSLLVGR